MLRMKALGRLVEWRNREHGALLVTGMPKTGKTALIEEFGRTYEHFVRIDLRGNPDLKSIFKRGSDAESVSKGVSACTDMEIVPGSTLLFIDGIQGCREALASLTRLSIDSKFDVIAAGVQSGIGWLLDRHGCGRAPRAVRLRREDGADAAGLRGVPVGCRHPGEVDR